MGKGKSGQGAYLGAALSRDKSEASWIGLLESLAIPDNGLRLLGINDVDQAIVSVLSFILTKAKGYLCVWHGFHNVLPKAKELFPNDREKVKKAIQVTRIGLKTKEPKTTSPLEWGIKEFRWRTRFMDGSKSRSGTINF